MTRTTMPLALLACTAVACSGNAPGEGVSVADDPALATSAAPGKLTVMTRNVYFGADIEPLLSASLEEVPVYVASAWAQMIGNDFPARARALAKEIADASPALVGLQEPALFRRFVALDAPPVEEIDFLAILEAELAARGADYRVVITQHDSDVLAPMLVGFGAEGAPIFEMVQMTDRDAILARADVETTQATSGLYAQRLPVSIGGEPLEIVRGWASVVAKTDRGSFRFVSTHLEDFVPEVQMAQAQELVGSLASETLPIVLVGDFNSAADGSGTPTYGYLTGAGFTDAWKRANPRDPGFTCCSDADLHGPEALSERIDLVLVREHGKAIHGHVEASIVGLAQTPEGLWPSDHAGVVASFRIP